MKKFLLFFSLGLLSVYSCSDDDGIDGGSNAVSFEVPSMNLTEDTANVVITFAKQTAASGVITLGIAETEAKYGTDYATEPAGSSGSLEVPFDAGVSKVSFTRSEERRVGKEGRAKCRP